MKYAQLISGLLLGTAIGGAVVAANHGVLGGGTSDAHIKDVVRQTISDEPKLIMDSVQKFQMGAQDEQNKKANDALKNDKDLQDKLYNDPEAAFVGPKDSKKVFVEFFDYDCPACKMMFDGVNKVVQEDKDVKVIFKEYPIFGKASEENSKIGIAVFRMAPQKYYEFHKKMIGQPSHAGNVAGTLKVVKDIGLNVDAVKKEAASDEVAKILADDRALGGKLQIQGTPSLVIGTELVPHALTYEDLKSKLDALPQ